MKMFSKQNQVIFILATLNVFTKVKCQFSVNQQFEQNLTTKLINSYYSRDIRPSEQVTIFVSIQLKQIISLDEKNQILTISCFIAQWWNDPRLTWTPASNNNINVLMLNLKKIWVPDTIVLNSADGDGYLKINSDFSYVPVDYNGNVYFATSSIGLKTRCLLNMQNYPVKNNFINKIKVV